MSSLRIQCVHVCVCVMCLLCIVHVMACWQRQSGRGLGNTKQGRLGIVSVKNSHMVVIKVLGAGPCLLCGFEGDGIFVMFPARAGGQILYYLPAVTAGWQTSSDISI